MGLRALIFDVDGTLADTEEVHRRAFNAAFAEHGLTWNWGRRVYGDLLKTAGGKERMLEFVSRLHLPPSERDRLIGLVPAIHRSKTIHYGSLLESGAELRPGIARLLQEARAAGLKLAVATTTTPMNVECLVKAACRAEARAVRCYRSRRCREAKKAVAGHLSPCARMPRRACWGLPCFRRFCDRLASCQGGGPLHRRDADGVDEARRLQTG
jgi:beta-phosphoglucomutase-like phosphatase (HAD superfamily)